MSLTTVDVVLELPDTLHRQALHLSELLVDRMREAGQASRFQLGHSFPEDGAGPCEPHVSLFMLAVPQREIGEVLDAVRSVAAASAPLRASGHRYGHNPQGAPELYFQPAAGWRALQRAVVRAVEPLRRGRLREVDPAGERLAEQVERLRREEPDGARLRQLLTYGYDEVDDRFSPHVTLAWPADAVPVDLAGLPAAEDLSGVLTHLAVFGMNGSGTCTTRYGTFPCEQAKAA
ncbi:MAG TPA: hypothetical protein VFM55_26950 [Micromonosporaceae bacterium]|nr:hypothetical protein [Micromonosporaceae bacterium]